MKKMLAILASPRKSGNAAQMLDAAVSKARESGYEVEFIDLYEKNIAWCKGCMSCKKTRVCAINDDIQKIANQLKACDLAAVTSPTYFANANVPAPLKNLFDRLVGVVMDDNDSPIPKPRLSPKQKYMILVTCNTPFPFDRITGQSTGTAKAIKEFFHISGMKHAGTVVYPGTRGKSKVPDNVIEKIRSIIGRL